MPSACAPPEAGTPRRIVVLGIGNTLLADEGVGVHAALALQREWALPDGVEVIDGGTAGMELLGPLAGADLLLVLDAVKAGRPPATLVQLEGDAVPAFFRAKLSQHQVSICDVLAGLEFEGAAPRELLLIGVEPASMALSLHMTPTIAARVPRMVEAAVRALAARGIVCLPHGAARAA